MQDDSGWFAVAQQRGSVSAMLVGFDKEIADQISAALEKRGWRVTDVQKDQEALTLFIEGRFDLVIFDIDQTEDYAPNLIKRFRSSEGRLQRAFVVAVASVVLPGMQDQIARAGADAFVPMNGALGLGDLFRKERASPASTIGWPRRKYCA